MGDSVREDDSDLYTDDGASAYTRQEVGIVEHVKTSQAQPARDKRKKQEGGRPV